MCTMIRLLLPLLLALRCGAREPAHYRAINPSSARAAVDTRPLITTEMVGNWIQKWQKLLALEDWKIEARVVRVWELPQDAVADIHWWLKNKSATVNVIDPVDSTLNESEIVDDTELSVIHELLHLSMAKLPLDGVHTECEEEAVKRVSVALQQLDIARRSRAGRELAARELQHPWKIPTR